MQLLPTPAPPNITSRIRSTSDIIQLCCVSARVCQLSAFTTTVATPCVLDEQFTTAHKSSMESAHKYFSDAKKINKKLQKLKFHQVVVYAVLSTLSKRINIQSYMVYIKAYTHFSQIELMKYPCFCFIRAVGKIHTLTGSHEKIYSKLLLLIFAFMLFMMLFSWHGTQSKQKKYALIEVWALAPTERMCIWCACVFFYFH